MISPEEMAETALKSKLVKTEEKDALFLPKATVVLFDGLILWIGDLNMKRAKIRLELLARALGLPVAVIGRKEMNEAVKRKKRKPGKLIGPRVWDEERTWDSKNGLDPCFWADYSMDCTKVEKDIPKTGKYDNLSRDEADEAFWKKWEEGRGIWPVY